MSAESAETSARHWNYRVIKSVDEAGGVTYGIHEVHYNGDGDANPCGWTGHPVLMCWETVNDMFFMLTAIQLAMAKPTLWIKNDKLIEIEDER